MKTKVVAALILLGINLGGLTLPSAFAVDAGSLTIQLSSVPRPELPAKAANLVLIAQGEDRVKVTEAVVNAAVDLNPVASPMIIGSISKLSPDMAPVAAAAAAVKQPKQARAIAKAAATSAPSQALKIVAAMCKGQPGEYREIAVAVAEAVPGMDSSIINTVIDAVPTLKTFYVRVAETFASGKSGIPSVSIFLGQISKDLDNSARVLKSSPTVILAQGVAPDQQSLLPSPPAPPPPPVVRPPFTGLGGTPGEINRNQTVEIPPGGPRNYSAP